MRERMTNPEKAGVGGSTPSLATMFSITCLLIPKKCCKSRLKSP